MKILRLIPLFILLLLPTLIFAQGFVFDPGGEIASSLSLPDREAEDVVIKYVKFVLTTIGLTATLMILYGGFRYMMSAGNEETIKQSKAILKTSTIGLVLVLSSWAIFNFVIAII